MHGLPCASLGNCFDNPSDINVEPSEQPDLSRQSRERNDPPAVEPVLSQPQASVRTEQPSQPQRAVSCISNHSIFTPNGTGETKNGHLLDQDVDVSFESASVSLSLSVHSDYLDQELDYSPEVDLDSHIPPQIPRPSIIIKYPQVKWFVLMYLYLFIPITCSLSKN